MNQQLTSEELDSLSKILGKLEAPLNRLTVGDLFQRYLDNHARPHLKTWRNLERCFRSYFIELRDLNCLAVKRIDVQRWYVGIGENIGWTTANRALELLRSVYYKCIDWELIPNYNPTTRLHMKKLRSRERFLQPEELARFFAACSSLRYATTRDFFLMCLFTGQRSGNVRQMRWDEISFELRLWTIPVTKNGTSHQVPLVPEAVAILQTRMKNKASEWVFPGVSTNQGKSTADRPLAKNGCRDAWLQVIKRAEIPDLRLHDLRRTHASYEAITGANISVIAHTLNHKDLTSTQIYARLHLDPVRQAMRSAVADMCLRAGIETVDDENAHHVVTAMGPAMPAVDELVSPKQAADLTGLSIAKLQSLRHKNEGPPYIKNGFAVYYSHRMLIAWMYGRRQS